MKFVAKIDPSTGEFSFATSNMKRLFHTVKDFYGRTGTYFQFSIDEVSPTTSDSQIALYKRLVMMVVNESGQPYADVSLEWHQKYMLDKQLGGKNLLGEDLTRKMLMEELSSKQFEEFLSLCIIDANDLFNMNLELYSHPDMGTLLTNKKQDGSI